MILFINQLDSVNLNTIANILKINEIVKKLKRKYSDKLFAKITQNIVKFYTYPLKKKNCYVNINFIKNIN